MKAQFLFLGSGASTGVPLIGCDCDVCTSKNPCNQRLRPSAWMNIGDKSFLIDVGPDFRQQALKYKIARVDAILITHAHYDHIAGLDDLRAYYFIQKKELPCLLSKESYFELRQRFRYLFKPKSNHSTICAQLKFTLIEDDAGILPFQGVEIHFFSYFQNQMKVTGYRIGSLAYVTDIRQYSDDIFPFLNGIDTLVVSALRHDSSKMHFTIDEAIHFASKVNAKQTYFTHIAHEIDHDKTQDSLPKSVHLAYDGLELEFEC